MNIFYLIVFVIVTFFFLFLFWGHATFERLKSERSFSNYISFISFFLSFVIVIHMFFSILFDDYISMTHAIVNFISTEGARDDLKHIGYLSLFASPLIIIGLIFFYAEGRTHLIEVVSKIGDYFFGIFRNLFAFLTSVLVLILAGVILYFVCAFGIFILGFPILMPITITYQDYSYITLWSQVKVVLALFLLEILIFYFVTEFVRFLEKIEYYLNGGINSGDIKPISFYRTYKRKLNVLFSKSNQIDWVHKLGKTFLILGEFIVLLFPRFIVAVFGLVLSPYFLVRSILRFVMRSVRSL